MTAPKTVLGGDDVRAIVADCGTWSIRVGSAGDDTPRSVIPAAIGHRPPPQSDAMSDADPTSIPFAGDQLLTAPHLFRDITSIQSPSGDGITINWDGMQLAWQNACDNLRLKPSESPFLVVEPTYGWPQEDRARALERAFEGLQVPAAFLARGSAMTAFASARPTACVLDIGYLNSTAIPVVEGFALHKRREQSVVGGKFLSERLRQWTEDILDNRPNYDGSDRRLKRTRDSEVKRVDWLRAHHELKRERIPSDDPIRRYKVTDISQESPLASCTSAHRNFYRLRLMEEMKMTTFRVSQQKTPENNEKEGEGKDEEKSPSAEGKPIENKEKESNGKENAKDGNGKDSKDKSKEKVSVERSSEYTLPDGNTLNLEENDGLEIANLLFTTKPDEGMFSMSDLVFKSISESDVDLRRDLFGCVVITGGTSMIPGVVERITKELAILIPQAYRLKVTAPPNHIERACASWIGGSIVASLGTFQQVWISKAEYDELGSTTALRKCP